MKALVYETKVDSGVAIGRRIFAAAEYIMQPSTQHCVSYRVSADAC
jgi:hypothetical protein